MANALVVHKDSLPLSQKALRAAQYVRMSTDLQKYSIENQAVVREILHQAVCSILLEFRECLCEVINTDVMEERGELLLLPLPCSLPYALQRL
jgi:hypothetical protein